MAEELRYAKLSAGYWRGPAVRQLGAVARHLYPFLCSQADLDHCGVLPVRIARWAEMAGWTETEITSALYELERPQEDSGLPFIVVDWTNQELFVRTYMRHDGIITQPNMVKAARKAFARLEPGVITEAINSEYPGLFDQPAADRAQASIPNGTEGFEDPPVNSPLNPSRKGSLKGSWNPSGRVPGRDVESRIPFSVFPTAAALVHDSVAGEAIRLLAAARTWSKPTRDADAYRAGTAAKAWEQHATAITRYLAEHPEATAEQIASDVLAVKPPAGNWDALRAEAAGKGF